MVVRAPALDEAAHNWLRHAPVATSYCVADHEVEHAEEVAPGRAGRIASEIEVCLLVPAPREGEVEVLRRLLGIRVIRPSTDLLRLRIPRIAKWLTGARDS